ncbi:hypothetical protein HNQ07_000931 [Deinococcus metalli]|uniref:Uncharacterized protein n=1 Tax=Deinococcus metalli TaxID=1141878 RepID=A0A7W8NQV8_9DEIO|nr:hypothetical protein [Deinococcus metalli]MBB5375487.1 hypothetical protein [Deinococcus metalli]GHF28906.1 hypothetical protein GCM10017781_01090 [Deinococcus metalli]
MNRTALAHLTLLAALCLVPASAQTMNHDASMSASSMSGLPMLHFTTEAGMNMMMGKSGDLMIMAAPGMGKYAYAMSGHTATITFASRDAKGLFAYYDKAIRAEGWTENTSMAMGMMGAGHYVEGYMMGKYKLDLSAVTAGARTTVTFKVH